MLKTKTLLIGLAFWLLASTAFATTLNPIQSLNPAGSTSGQAIVSSGPTSAPAWGNVSIATLTGVLPIANGGTGQTSVASALTALGGLSTTTAASTYLTQVNAASTYGAKASSLSQFAATTSAQLAGVLSDETGTGVAVFGTAPTITAPNIVGATSGTAAPAGSVGEQLAASTSSTPMTTATAMNATSKLLTAGQYQVSCTAQFIPSGSTTLSLLAVGISTTSATRPGYANEKLFQLPFSTGLAQQIDSPVVNLNVSTSTTVYCTAYASFGVSTMTVSGTINALRVR